MKNWFKNLFLSKDDQRLKNLEIQALYLHSRIGEIQQIVDQQTQIITQMARLQSEISNIIWEETHKSQIDETISAQMIAIVSDDEFIN